MDLQEALGKAEQILVEERINPTVTYELSPTAPVTAVLSPYEGGIYPRNVRENPAEFQLKSVNFSLLCTLLDQVRQQERTWLFGSLRSRISDPRAYRHKSGAVLGAGSWLRCTSELPLIAEFLVRRGDKHFVSSMGGAAVGPGLSLLLIQLEQMIAFNFTLFTEEEYIWIPTALDGIKIAIGELQKRPKPQSTIESNTVYHVVREVPDLCDRVAEACRKARFFYVKDSLLPEMNLEVNEDKNRVRTFLEKLGFPRLLIESLDEAEKLYRTAATPFELKSSMGHLRSFLERLHLEACVAAQKRFGGCLPSKWGEALKYLRDHDLLTLKEEQFAAQFFALLSDTGVHPLVAEREYARLMRNMSIEYGLLLLTKVDKFSRN
jgi:hypothetical protein